MLPSLFLAWVIGFLVRRNAPGWGLVDHPTDGHKGHDQPTPLGGGLAIAFAVVFPFALGQFLLLCDAYGIEAVGWNIPDFVSTHAVGLIAQSAKLWTVLGAACVLMLIGLIDDSRGLHWTVRLVSQFIVAAVVVWMFDWGLTAFIPFRIASQSLAVIWIVALINAFNMLDNMDGLSAGVTTICSAALATVLFIAPDPATGQPQLFVIGFLLVLIGSLIGFLAHNTPPAKLFMGDAGSYFIGFCLAIATMQATYTDYHSPRPHAALAPLCIMAVPLYDMVSVIAIRLWKRQSIFQADRRHFSHRLVDAGLSKTAAVGTIYGVTAATGVAALFLHRVSFRGAIYIFAAVGCSLMIMAVVERLARLRKKRRERR